MATKRTYINANEELIVQGKLLVQGNASFQGNVTQIEDTTVVTNLQGETFTINSDGDNVTASINLNSNGSLGTLSFADGENIKVEPGLEGNIIVGSGQTLTVAGGASINGNVFFGNVSGTAAEATVLETARNFSITGDGTASAVSFNGSQNVELDLTLDASGVSAGTYGNASTIPSFTVDSKGLLTSASQSTVYITSNEVSDFNTAISSYIVGGAGLTETSGDIAVGQGTGLTVNADDVALNVNYVLGQFSSTNVTTPGDSDLLSNSHLSYNAGVFTFTAPLISDVRATISGGGGVTYNSSTGQLGIDGSTVFLTGNDYDSSSPLNGNILFDGGQVAFGSSTDVFANVTVTLPTTDGNTYTSGDSGGSKRVATTEYVEAAINSLVGGAPSTLDTLNELAAALNDDENIGASVVQNTTDIATLNATNISAGDGLTGGGLFNANVTINVVGGNGITANANDVAIDTSVVVDVSSDQTIAGAKTFTDELIVPSSAVTTAGGIYYDASSTKAYIYINGAPQEITPAASVGTVLDVGSSGINVYAGSIATGNTTTHYIKSIDGGTYTNATESSNVITIDADISAVRGAFSGSGDLSYNSGTGAFSFTERTDSEVRGLLSGTGAISYNSSTGVISTTADNYSSWGFTTDSAGTESITSGETLTFVGGSGVSVTHSGSTVTINGQTGDITSVAAGSGLSGGGSSGAVTLSLDNSAVRGLFSGSGDISYNSSTGEFSFTDSDRSDATIRGLFSAGGDLSYNSSTGEFSFTNDAGDIESVTAGNGLTGGGSSGGVTLNVVGGYGIDVNANNIEVSNSDIQTQANVAIDDKVTTAFVNALNVNATTVDGVDATQFLRSDSTDSHSGNISPSVNNSQGLGSSSNKYAEIFATKFIGDVDGTVDDISNHTSTIRGLFSAGGDLSYSNGVFSFTERTDAQVRGLLSGGTGITYNSSTGAISLTDTGLITGVTAGAGLTDGGTSGTVTVNVGAGAYIDVNANDIAVDATTAATASKVVARDGAGNVAANYFVGTATAAQYADLAEIYSADADYEPGTVLIIGGQKEVTVTDEAGSYKVAGVVSTNPAYLMNSEVEGVAVALRGRVPCKVIGNVNKGDVLIASDTPGYAMVGAMAHNLSPLQIVGRALESKTDAQPGVVEILV